MRFREQDKHFLWSLILAVGVILVWKGLWEGVYEIPYVGYPWVALCIGLFMLTFSGLIFREFDPLGSLDKSVKKITHFVHSHPEKHKFQIKYHDKIRKKDITIDAQTIKKIEKGSLVINDEKRKQEIFIPAHRITEVIHQGKSYWRL